MIPVQAPATSLQIWICEHFFSNSSHNMVPVSQIIQRCHTFGAYCHIAYCTVFLLKDPIMLLAKALIHFIDLLVFFIFSQREDDSLIAEDIAFFYVFYMTSNIQQFTTVFAKVGRFTDTQRTAGHILSVLSD